MNTLFYRPLDQFKKTYMNDPRGYISPYTDANIESETEHKIFMSKYMQLRNWTNHPLKTRCNGRIYRGLL